MDLKKMGKFISELRKKQSLTQVQLGEIVGVSGKAVSKWERGVSAPDISLLKSLSNSLNVSVTELLSGEKIENDVSTDVIGDITLSSIEIYNKLLKKKYSKFIIFAIGIIFLSIVLFSVIYLIFNYDRCFVYQLNSENKEFRIEGLLVSNQKESSLLITGIKYTDPNKDSENELLVERAEIILIIGKYIIYSEKFDCNSSKLRDELNKKYIYVNENQKLKDLLDIKNNQKNMYLKIKYVSTDNNVGNFTVPIELVKRFSNNKLIY